MDIQEFTRIKEEIKKAPGVKITQWNNGEKFTTETGNWYAYESGGYIEYLFDNHTGLEYRMRTGADGRPVDSPEISANRNTLTGQQLNALKEQAGRMIPTRRYTEEPPFCAQPVITEEYDVNGYRLVYQDGMFLTVYRIGGHRGQTPVTVAQAPNPDYTAQSDEELQAKIQEMQKEVDRRNKQRTAEAVHEFMEAWEKLKKFPDARLRIAVSAVSPGAAAHGHYKVKDISIETLPL